MIGEPAPPNPNPYHHKYNRDMHSSGCDSNNKFHLFPYLPAELRLQVWRQAVLSACQHGRLHRVRLAVISSAAGSVITLLPTRELAGSTYSTRALLAACSEARRECIPFLPDTLPLRLGVGSRGEEEGGGLFRCDVARDILALDHLSPELLVQLADLILHQHRRYPSLFGSIRHLGLNLTLLLREDDEGCEEGPAVSPAIETAMVPFLRMFERLEGVYLLTGSRGVILGDDCGGGVVRAVLGALSTRRPPGDYVFMGAEHETSEWFTTRPFASCYIAERNHYYARLRAVMRLLCQLKLAMDAPAVGMDSEMEWLQVKRLEEVKVRLLWQYVVDGKTNGEEDGKLELSSPQRCLEVALGRQPRWLQWEFVCQCLDC